MLKSLTLFAICLLLQLNIFADDEKKIKSEIKKVTVYLKGAQITRTANTNIEKGRTIIVLESLSSKINSESISISGSDNFTIISVVHNYNYLNQKKSTKEISILKSKRENLLDSITKYKKIELVYEQEKIMILANKSIGGQTEGVSIDELKAAANFFRSRLTEIELKLLNINGLTKIKNKEIIKLSRQLAEQNVRKDMPTSEIRITVSAKSDVKAKFKIKYIINNAGWTPNYDIRIKDVNNPLKLVYKAKVYQNTDENWKNIKLSLSTGNPSVSSAKPNLSPYYLSFNNYYKKQKRTSYNYQTKGGSYRGTVSGIITDENGEVIPGANIRVKGLSNVGTITDLDGRYELEVPNNKRVLVISFIGMKPIEKYINSDQLNVSLSTSDQELSEVVVTGYGKRSNSLKKLYSKE